MMILTGDCLKILPTLDAESVQMVCTSPPYYGLRSYGIGTENGEIGLEATPEIYVAKLVEVFRQVRRVLRNDGTVWLNLGISYVGSANTGGTGKRGDGGVPYRIAGLPSKHGIGLKPKDLIGIPWRVAFALQADGWWLRQDIIWAKPNPMPESVTDRCTKSHEYIFLLTKSARYFYDAEAIKEDAVSDGNDDVGSLAYSIGSGRNDGSGTSSRLRLARLTRNRRSVWTISTKPFKEAHFATFPPEIPEICIKAGTSEKGCCPECGSPWERVTKRVNSTTGWRPTCTCHRGDFSFPPIPCTVLDPFSGAGTTGNVAKRLGRKYTGIELSPEYAEMSKKRIDAVKLPLFE